MKKLILALLVLILKTAPAPGQAWAEKMFKEGLVHDPGGVTFGSVGRGQTPTQTIDGEYAGGLPWQLKEIAVPRDFPFAVTSREIYRRPGQVGYQLQVMLKADAPIGPIKDELF